MAWATHCRGRSPSLRNMGGWPILEVRSVVPYTIRMIQEHPGAQPFLPAAKLNRPSTIQAQLAAAISKKKSWSISFVWFAHYLDFFTLSCISHCHNYFIIPQSCSFLGGESFWTGQSVNRLLIINYFISQANRQQNDTLWGGVLFVWSLSGSYEIAEILLFE